MASPKISLKLLVDAKGKRVLFAEASKEFVDFLFHIFSLPMGALIQLLGSNNMVGCLGKLKASIESFHGTYLQPGVKLDDIFNHNISFNGNTFLLPFEASSECQCDTPKAVYRCPKATRYDSDGYYTGGTYPCKSVVTLYKNSACPDCGGSMNVEIKLIGQKQGAQTIETKEAGIKRNNAGYVKEVVTYMVMDDLVVKPMSSISSITLINKLGVTDLSQLEEKIVSFGKEEGLKLLMASLKTDKVLTTIFLH